ncbi:MAG: hypothetical protein WKG32_16315 [Gemmatimonadaceae bacterium]
MKLVLHPAVRWPLLILALLAAAAGVLLLGAAATVGWPLTLVWRGALAVAIGAVAFHVGWRRTARS